MNSIERYFVMKSAVGFFKKLHLLDYLIILAVLLFGIITYKYIHMEEKWVDFVAFSRDVSIFQANSLHTGDYEVDSSGKKIAEITGLQIFEAISKPDAITSNKNVFIKGKLLAQISSKSKELQYKNKIIKVGSQVQFIFNNGQIGTTLAELDNIKSENLTEVKTITIKLYNQYPWFSDAIQIGESKTDENGKKITEIISKESHPAEITTVTQTGATQVTTDPQKVDITLTVRVHAQRLAGQLIYNKEIRLLVGELISFTLGNTRIENAQITDIK